MEIDATKVDLNAPAFGAGAQTIESVSTNSTAIVTPVVAPVSTDVTTDNTTTVDPANPEPVEEGKVPYSRFKKFHDLATQHEAQANEWKAKFEAAQANPNVPQYAPVATIATPMPTYWVQLYGDSDASQQAWDVQSQQNAQLIEQVRKTTLDTVQAAQSQVALQEQQNLAQIDAGIELLGDYVGRPLTAKEQDTILDIVDEFTPKDNNGNYLGATMPFEKAWDIYELKNQASNAPAQAARNNVAGLSGAQSQGATAITEQNKDFNPMDWDGYKSRI